ncbi:MAG: hypothetical protein WC529_00885 [Candidatus Margulisiibacteriota bacterium]
MKIPPDNNGKTWSVSSREIRAKLPLIKPAFVSWLRTYGNQAVILDHAGPALTALAQEAKELTRLLGGDFLSLALGGSLIRGLGTVETSDVDYFIYTRDIGQQWADTVRDGSWQRLRQAGLTPCDDHPVIRLAPGLPDIAGNTLGVFTNHLVFEAKPGASRRMVLEVLAQLLAAAPPNARRELKETLRSEYNTLMHNSQAYAARKFVQNRVRPLIGEAMSESMLCDQHCLDELARLAAPFITARRVNFPPPPELASLLA